jgi:hypothetical protein
MIEASRVAVPLQIKAKSTSFKVEYVSFDMINCEISP